MKKQLSLKNTIINSLANTAMTSDNMTGANGNIYWDDLSVEQIDGNTYDLTFRVSVVGDEFEWNDDNQTVTRATVDFELYIKDCAYDLINNKFILSSDKIYSLSSDSDRTNVITQCGDMELNEGSVEGIFADGLDEYDDIDITKELIDIVVKNTSVEQMINACQIIILSANAPYSCA